MVLSCLRCMASEEGPGTATKRRCQHSLCGDGSEGNNRRADSRDCLLQGGEEVGMQGWCCWFCWWWHRAPGCCMHKRWLWRYQLPLGLLSSCASLGLGVPSMGVWGSSWGSVVGSALSTEGCSEGSSLNSFSLSFTSQPPFHMTVAAAALLSAWQCSQQCISPLAPWLLGSDVASRGISRARCCRHPREVATALLGLRSFRPST